MRSRDCLRDDKGGSNDGRGREGDSAHRGCFDVRPERSCNPGNSADFACLARLLQPFRDEREGLAVVGVLGAEITPEQVRDIDYLR